MFLISGGCTFDLFIKPAEQHNPTSCFVTDSEKMYSKKVISTKRNLYSYYLF